MHYGALNSSRTPCGIDLIALDLDDPRGARTLKRELVTCEGCKESLDGIGGFPLAEIERREQFLASTFPGRKPSAAWLRDTALRGLRNERRTPTRPKGTP